MNVTKVNHKTIKKTLRIIGKDILLAFIGLVISIIIAIAVNSLIREEITGWLN
jgi:hypothetical protein